MLPELERDISQAHKAQILNELVEKLKVYVDYDNYDPKQLPEFHRKQDYKCVNKLIGHDYHVLAGRSNESVFSLQALPDGKIVSGNSEYSICIWDETRQIADVNQTWPEWALQKYSQFLSKVRNLSTAVFSK